MYFPYLFATLIVLLIFLFYKLLSWSAQKNNERKKQSEFMSVVIHELRSPLSVIRSSADLILTESEALSQMQINSMLSQIKSSATDLLELVTKLLDISKIEAGRVEIFKNSHDFEKFIFSEAKNFEAMANDKGLEFSVNVEGTIGSFVFDIEKIKRILLNLISNAIKYTESGYVKLNIKRVGNKVRFEVIDTGMGITEDMKSKLFNKFVQASEKASSLHKGTGLGLVITKGIVEAHGGKLWIEDNKPKGSKFIFEIPYEVQKNAKV